MSMARRRFFVDEVHAGRARLEGGAAHHLTRVLRVEPGQMYEISDNTQVYLAEVETARKDLIVFNILDRIPSEEPLVSIAIYASLIRFERLETLIEKATELGVDRIIPVRAERSEKGLDMAALKRLPRWRRIVHEASEQSRRTRLTEITEPLRLREAVSDPVGFRLTLDEDPGAAPLLRAVPQERVVGQRASLIAGPEGGWTDRERALLTESGWRSVSLGRTVLKTETALVAGIAIVNAAWQAA